MTSSPLKVKLFGCMQIHHGSKVLSLPASAPARSLLAYLILNHERALPRLRLAETFWPKRSEELARRTLSNTLWQVRGCLQEAAERLATEGENVLFHLNARDWLDVAEFEQLLETPSDTPPTHRIKTLQAAIKLYRDDLLANLYDDWCLLERERLRERYLWGLEQLLMLQKQLGAYDDALATAHRLVAADSLRESAHRELMRLYHVLDRPRAALQQFQTLRAALAQELDVQPTSTTLSLCREIAASLEETEAPYLPQELEPPLLGNLAHLPFVGRKEERAQLLHVLKAALQGHGGLAIVRGAAGVGKTRLVQELISDAEWRGFQVGLAKVSPLGAVPPYQLLREALASLLTPLRIFQLAEIAETHWLSALAPLFPSIDEQVPNLPPLPPLDRHAEWQRLWDALGHTLRALASITPLLLVLEDVHWGDNASLAALPHLAQHLADAPLLLVLTSRIVEAQERSLVLETFEAAGQNAPLTRVTLPPFTSDEIDTLLHRALTGRVEDVTFAEQLAVTTGGNALHLLESLKLLFEQGTLIRETGGRWALPKAEFSLEAPTSIRELIEERVARLPSATREMLELAAVLGENADFSVFATAKIVPPEELPQHLERLRKRGFLRQTGTGYRFEHDLVRSGVYDSLAQPQQQALHRRAGEALESVCPGRVDSLAQHFDLGDVPEKAITYRLQAAEHARRLYDYKTALRHYRHALVRIDAPARRWDVLADLEAALHVLGQREEQEAILEEMLVIGNALDDPVKQATTHQRIGWRKVLTGDVKQALSDLEEAARLARAAGDDDLLGHCFIAEARAWWTIGDTRRCQAAIEDAHALFKATNNSLGLSKVLNMHGNLHLGHTGDFAAALRYFQAHRRNRHKAQDRYGEAGALGNIGITYELLGAYERSQEALARALEVMEQTGDSLWQGILKLGQADNYYQTGQPVRAQTLAEEALHLCQEVGNRNFESETWRLLGQIALDWDEADRAAVCFQHALDVANAGHQLDVQARHQSHLAQAYLRLGQLEEAERLSSLALETSDALGDFDHTKDICFERYVVISETQGTRAAQPYLERAQRLLMKQANQIGDPELRATYLHNVRHNRAILLARQIGRPPTPVRYQRAQLARRNTPTGRPLTADETVEVIWTLASLEDNEITGKAERRRNRIRRLLREAADQGAEATVDDLAQALDVSARTIKRDLAALRAAGHDVSTRGSRDS